MVDGRGAQVSGKENGTYVGPTVIDYVKPEMSVAKEEIFGPVISIMRTKTVDEALAIANIEDVASYKMLSSKNSALNHCYTII